MSKFFNWIATKPALAAVIVFGSGTLYEFTAEGFTLKLAAWFVLTAVAATVLAGKGEQLASLASDLFLSFLSWAGNLTIGKYGWPAALFFWGVVGIVCAYVFNVALIGGAGVSLIVWAIMLTVRNQAK